MRNVTVIFLVGFLLVAACAKAEPSLSSYGSMFAPVGGLVALTQPENEERPASNRRVARLPDSKISWEVSVRLLDPSIGASEVKVSVRNQEVVLTGTVSSGAQADDMELAARRAKGVLSVKNLVTLR